MITQKLAKEQIIPILRQHGYVLPTIAKYISDIDIPECFSDANSYLYWKNEQKQQYIHIYVHPTGVTFCITTLENPSPKNHTWLSYADPDFETHLRNFLA